MESVFETPIPVQPKELYDWHLREGAFARLSPPWLPIRIDRPASVAEGSRAHLRMKKGPLWVKWVAEHSRVEPGVGFVDTQVSGPFAKWVHQHSFLPHLDSALLRDRIEFELPGGPLGRALAHNWIREDLETTFTYRHETTKRDLERHELFADRPRLRVAVSGSSGLVGGNLDPFLTTGGHHVTRLTRSSAEPPGGAQWSVQDGLLDPELLEAADAVVHLAGESIAQRWTPARKERIRSSRIDGTRNLVRSLARLEKPPRTFVCASAIGIYGSRGDELLDEDSTAGDGFLAEVCREWEEAAQEAAALGMRVVHLRFGIVLTPAGGALAKMLPPFQFGLGGRLGSGRQYMSWVSIDDAVGAIYQALYDERLSGPVNVVAPEPVTNATFTRALGRVLRFPTVLPVPELAAKALLGEMANELLLSSARVRPHELQGVGFRFHDTDLEPALTHLLGKTAGQ